MRTLLFFLLVVSVSGCATGRKKYTYEVCLEEPAGASELTKDELTGASDTKFAAVSGKVIAKSTNEPVVSSVVVFHDPNSGNVFSSNTNFDGDFSVNLPPGIYTVSVTDPYFSEFSQQIAFKAGELRRLEITLGDQRAFVSYQIQSRKKMNEEELNKVEQELRNH